MQKLQDTNHRYSRIVCRPFRQGIRVAKVVQHIWCVRHFCRVLVAGGDSGVKIDPQRNEFPVKIRHIDDRPVGGVPGRARAAN